MNPNPKVLNASVFLLAIISLVAGYLVVSDILQRNYRQALAEMLASNLAGSERAVQNWIATHTAEVEKGAEDPTILAAAEALLQSPRDAETLRSHPAQQQLRNYFGALLLSHHTGGYFIISPDGTSLAALDDDAIGTPNTLLSQPIMFEQILDGEPLLTRMRRIEDPHSDSADIRDTVTNFAAAPLRNDAGEVIAILALRLRPREELFRLLHFVEAATGLQAYAFWENGTLLTEVDEAAQLESSGVWGKGQDHPLLEPAKTTARTELPPRLILPVREALRGENGVNTEGYVNFAGIESVGSWYYFDKLSFGLVIEQPKRQAYKLARFFDSMTITAFSIGLVVATGVFLLMIEAGKRVDAHRKRLVAAMKATSDVNFQLDDEGIICNVNDAFKTVFGLPARDAIGHSIARFLTINTDGLTHLGGDELRRLAQMNKTMMLRCKGVHQDGSSFPIGIRVEPLALEGTIPDEYLVVVHDYSEIERREGELREALEQAEAGSRAKSSFLSTISHELRSPLISIIAALELLTLRASSAEDRNMLDSSERSAQMLLGIIDDILDFSRMEAGKLELSKQRVSLENILSDVTDVLRWQAWNNDVELVPFCAPDLPAVHIDGLRLRQILLNLVNNAIKFSAAMQYPGKVSVSITGQENAKGQLLVLLRVRDNGIGMSQDTMGRIFSPFVQGDGSIRRKFGGTGLGLTISDRLIKMMEGHISVISDLGEGTVFEVELPLDLAPPPAVPSVAKPAEPAPEPEIGAVAEPDLPAIATDKQTGEQTGEQAEQRPDAIMAAAERPAPLAPSRLLIDSDDPAITEIITTYAESAGATILPAPTANGGNSNPDLIVLVHPNANRMVQLQERYGMVPQLHVIKRGGDAPHVLQQENVCHIATTSLLPREVIERMQRLIQGTRAGDKALGLLPQGRVLLIEDDEITREITMRMLGQLGVPADAVVNGQEGLDLWRSGQYSLLLSDCHMPIMDGFQMAAQIRTEEGRRKLRKTPIIAVSADLTMEVERLCQDCEIDEYVPKPLTPAKLKAILQSHIGNGRNSGI